MGHPAPDAWTDLSGKGARRGAPFSFVFGQAETPRPAPFEFLSQVGPLNRCANAPRSYMLKVYRYEIQWDKTSQRTEAFEKRWSAL